MSHNPHRHNLSSNSKTAGMLNQFAWPVSLQKIGWHTYIIFTIWCGIQATVVYFFIPETKNRTVRTSLIPLSSYEKWILKNCLHSARGVRRNIQLEKSSQEIYTEETTWSRCLWRRGQHQGSLIYTTYLNISTRLPLSPRDKLPLTNPRVEKVGFYRLGSSITWGEIETGKGHVNEKTKNFRSN